MKKFVIGLLTLCLTSSLTAQQSQWMNDSLNAFAYKFHQQLLELNQEDNLFFSPLSISSAMAMPYLGARGETAGEFMQVMAFPEDTGQYSQSWNATLDALSQRYEKKAEFRLANSIWLHKRLKLNGKFRHAVSNELNAEVFEVNFSSNRQRKKAREKANQWVEDLTDNRIQDLIKPGMLNPFTRLMLINAIYFKAAWKHPFKEKNTRDEAFYAAGGTKVKTAFMHSTESMRFYEDSLFKMVGIPYEHPYLEMFIVKPGKNVPLTRAASRFFQPEYTSEVFSNMRYGQVKLALPKFRIEKRYALKPFFQQMGMKQAFNDSADFSGITNDKSLKIDKVVHQTFIEIDEKGTEAAAATAVTMKLKTAIGQEPFVFRADSPFLFFIRDRRNELVYFAGALRKPAPAKE